MYDDALMIEPMKINKLPEGKENMLQSICESGDYFGQIKKDGYWYMYESTDTHNYLFSRNTSVLTQTLAEKGDNVPHIMEALNGLPPKTILIGEIYYPGKRSKDVTPIMGALPEKAVARQTQSKYGLLHYYIHDIIYYNGTDLTNYGASVRYEILKKVYEKYNLKFFDYLELAERFDEGLFSLIAIALESGEEGMVLKKKTAPYTPGKRPVWDTIKVKQTDTCDAICLGFNAPKEDYTGKEIESWPYWMALTGRTDENGVDIVSWKRMPEGSYYEQLKENEKLWRPVTKAYYFGWVNAMRVGAYDKDGNIQEIGTVSSGMEEVLQEDAAKHPLKYIGKVVELAGMQKDHNAKTLRHFYFKKFRTDKDAKDCLMEDIF